MLRIGLTGGIGCGKSAVATWLAGHGVPVIDTDDVARAVVGPGQPALLEVRNRFGNGILAPDGTLDRARMAKIVFGDAEARSSLESILHPLIQREWTSRLSALESSGAALAVVVIPLLFEKGYQSHFDEVVTVACSPGTQRSRLLARGWTDEEIRLRNAAQWTVEAKVAAAGTVIWSEGRLSVMHRQLERVLGSLGC